MAVMSSRLASPAVGVVDGGIMAARFWAVVGKLDASIQSWAVTRAGSWGPGQ
jgi:hypothetical protein